MPDFARIVVALVSIVAVSGACGGPGAGQSSGSAGQAPAEDSWLAPAPTVPMEEYGQRRLRIMDELPEGILLLHAKPAGKSEDQWGFVQDATFLYFSGLSDLPGAVLAIDGVARASHLFLPPPPISFGLEVKDLVPEPGAETAARLGLDSARPWDGFVDWLRERVADGVTTLYVNEARRPEPSGVPPGLPALAGDHRLWRDALERTVSGTSVASAKDAILRLRAVKSSAEIRILRVNARRTARSLQAAARRLSPGVRQRDVEAAVVSSCIEAGGQGPSFWPWTMAGRNAHPSSLVQAFFRYEHLDRRVEAGELARIDIGCAGGLYGADVGRTLPVSGRFSEGQAEAWNLLVAGYRAGLAAMRPGAAVDEVRRASLAAVSALESTLVTEQGRAALAAIVAGGPGIWHIHGVGIESGEDLPDRLEPGMVVAYEPGVAAGGDAFYLEDMIAITEGGIDVLSDHLPYTAEEVEQAMAPS